MKKKDVILNAIEEEDRFWKYLAKSAMSKAWNKEDSVWDKMYAPARYCR